MNIYVFTAVVGVAVATLFEPVAHRAHADPIAEGYDVYALPDKINWPRGIERRDDRLLVISVRGALYEVERSGETTELVPALGGGTWIDVAYDPGSGNIYASNLSYGYVAKYVDGTVERLVDGIPGAAGLALSDNGGTVYTSSYTGNQVHAYDIPTALGWSCAQSSRPDGLALWNGSLYIANRGDKRIDVIDDVLLCETPRVCAQGMFSDPIGIGHGDDELFVADYRNGSIFRLGSDCGVTRLASGFNGPVGAVQIGENIFVSEYNTNTIWVLTPSSIRGTVAGLAPPISVMCENLSDGTIVPIELGVGECNYNCTLAGLDAADGDLIKIDIQASTPDPSTRPLFEFTDVPPVGSNENLVGYTAIEDPQQYAVATYIKVFGGWWTKPYWAHPTVPVDADGVFVVDITTGGHDPAATEIVAYLVENDYTPPSLGGGPFLPSVLDGMKGDCGDFALAKASAVRVP